MNKLFIPYEQSLDMRSIGFDEPCLKNWDIGLLMICDYATHLKAPLYQQAFKWLYQKLNIEKGVMPLDIESQQLLLKELIDKVSSKHLLV